MQMSSVVTDDWSEDGRGGHSPAFECRATCCFTVVSCTPGLLADGHRTQQGSTRGPILVQDNPIYRRQFWLYSGSTDD